MLKKLLPLLLCITCATASVNAEVIEVRKKSALNPTVSCSGVAGDPALGNELKRFLSVCGWFDAAAPGKTADYTVKAERAGAFVNALPSPKRAVGQTHHGWTLEHRQIC